MAQLLSSYDQRTELKLYRISGQLLSITTTNTTSTHVSGGGARLYQGTGHIDPISITTSHQTHHDLYLIQDNGQEQHYYISNDLAHANFRQGHYLVIYFVHGKFFQNQPCTHTAIIYNRNLGMYYESRLFGYLANKSKISEAQRFYKMIFKHYFHKVLIPISFIGYGIGVFFALLFKERIDSMTARIVITIVLTTILCLPVLIGLYRWTKSYFVDFITLSFNNAKQVKSDILSDMRHF